jgi:hypothetical protein
MRGEFACFAVRRACRKRAQKARKTARPPPHWCRSHQRTDSWSHPGCVLDRVCLALEPSWMPPGAILVKKTAENRPNNRFSKREEKKSARIAAICTSDPHPLPLSRKARGAGVRSQKLRVRTLITPRSRHPRLIAREWCAGRFHRRRSAVATRRRAPRLRIQRTGAKPL